MNESNQGQPQSFELPTPHEGSASGERPASQPETQPIPPAGSQSVSMPTTDPSQLAQPVKLTNIQDDKPADNTVATDLDAHDLDVIEKEWVKKAKDIIERTSADPYKQKDEISAFSADYLRKRYGKDVKLDK